MTNTGQPAHGEETPGKPACDHENASQPAREENIRALVSFFEGGRKQCAQKLGIELEHTLIAEGNVAVPYHGEHGVEWVLGQLGTHYPAQTRDAQGDLLGVSANGNFVTIEPAAQVELSAGPFASLAEAQACFEDFEQRLADILEPAGIRALTLGYHPFAKATDLELIPKFRYEAMDAYFEGISHFGRCMMRGSASTQISIDYTSTEDCLRKLRLAFALAPLLSLICDNAPVFEGAPRGHRLVRTEIWRRCDPDRCGVVPGIMGKSFTLDDYARYILDTPAIVAPCTEDAPRSGKMSQTHDALRTDARTFGEIYAQTPMTTADIEHALSMLFTDVRLKTYIEIRPADAMPIPYVIAYAALIKGLFYREESLCSLDQLFDGVREGDIDQAKVELMQHGYRARIYGRDAAALADDVVHIANDGLSQDDLGYLEPLATLVAQRLTLADLANVL